MPLINPEQYLIPTEEKQSHIQDDSTAAVEMENKEEGYHCSLDTFMENGLNVSINEFHTMLAHKIKECNKDFLCTATEK